MGIRVEFGKYELVERLASGGMGETWLADLNAMEGVKKQVVIKKLLPDLASQPAIVRAFIEEARLSASFSHGNIAQVFDFGQVDGEYFLALEFVHGQSLERVLARAKKRGSARLPFPLTVFIVSELLKALHYAHTRTDQNGQPIEVVHRDVTPDNVLISYDGDVKLVDFGVAKTSELGRTKTSPGMVKGKYRYHSPEQALARVLDRRSDVFGAGIVLFEMLSGGPMFTATGHVAMQQVAYGEIPNLRVRAPDVPEALADIAMRAVAHDKNNRWQTALQMQEALTRWLFSSSPSFSAELLRELMSYLFERELADEGRAPVKNVRRTEELEALISKTPPVPPPGPLPPDPKPLPPDPVPPDPVPTPVAAPAARKRPAGLFVAAGLGVAVLVGGVALWNREPVATCERAGERGLAQGDEEAARAAIRACLDQREPTAMELQALAIVDTCAMQRVRLKEAKVAFSVAEPDRVERALGFAPSSCVAAEHEALRKQLQAVRSAIAARDALSNGGPQRVEPSSEAEQLPALRPPNVAAEYEAAVSDAKAAKDYAAMRDVAQKCVKADPRSSQCYLWLGDALGGLGKGAAGAAAYRKFLQLEPNHPKAAAVRNLLREYESH